MSDWQTHAACAGMNPALFFPEREQGPEFDTAARVCDRCPVRAVCLEDAIADPSAHGVRGGTSWSERARIRRRRSKRPDLRGAVLRDLGGRGWTAPELAERHGRTVNHMYATLRQLRMQGLVVRSHMDDGPDVFTLAEQEEKTA